MLLIGQLLICRKLHNVVADGIDVCTGGSTAPGVSWMLYGMCLLLLRMERSFPCTAEIISAITIKVVTSTASFITESQYVEAWLSLWGCAQWLPIFLILGIYIPLVFRTDVGNCMDRLTNVTRIRHAVRLQAQGSSFTTMRRPTVEKTSWSELTSISSPHHLIADCDPFVACGY